MSKEIIATDVYIVYAKSKRQAKRIQRKMRKLGFSSGFKNDKFECYYLATIWHARAGFIGNSSIRWGRDEVKTNPFFEKRQMAYKDFMRM